jgi:hypothetical protein
VPGRHPVLQLGKRRTEDRDNCEKNGEGETTARQRAPCHPRTAPTEEILTREQESRIRAEERHRADPLTIFDAWAGTATESRTRPGSARVNTPRDREAATENKDNARVACTPLH